MSLELRPQWRPEVSFVVPLTLPGDDTSSDGVMAFWRDATQGLYVQPNNGQKGISPTRNSPHSKTAKAAFMPA